jgi:hypothetical protein
MRIMAGGTALAPPDHPAADAEEDALVRIFGDGRIEGGARRIEIGKASEDFKPAAVGTENFDREAEVFGPTVQSAAVSRNPMVGHRVAECH